MRLHVEVQRPVADEHVELLEGAGVQQLGDPLAGGQLALVVLLVNGGLAGVVDRMLAQPLELGQLFLIGLGSLVSHHGGRVYAMAAEPGASRAPMSKSQG